MYKLEGQYVTDKINKYVGIFYKIRSSLTVTSLTHLCPDSFYVGFCDIAQDRLFSSTDS